MTQAEIEAVLQAAFRQCETAGYPLDEQQKVILSQTIKNQLRQATSSKPEANPLDRLTPEQLQALLRFVKQQEQQNASWKVTLFNDWLQGRTSGEVQFIRDVYGVQWLESITPAHLIEYEEEVLQLKVGDRIEVSNGLWEWVQETGPCRREWFPCVIINVTRSLNDPENSSTKCTVRFENGSEYEIQNIYDWNRPNWRWAKG